MPITLQRYANETGPHFPVSRSKMHSMQSIYRAYRYINIVGIRRTLYLIPYASNLVHNIYLRKVYLGNFTNEQQIWWSLKSICYFLDKSRYLRVGLEADCDICMLLYSNQSKRPFWSEFSGYSNDTFTFIKEHNERSSVIGFIWCLRDQSNLSSDFCQGMA